MQRKRYDCVMTLNTRIYLDGPIGGKKAFDLALAALCKADDRESDAATAKSYPPETRDGHILLRTVLGQGLPGIVDCRYCPDGPLAVEDVIEDGWTAQRACVVEVGWDTAYGFSNGRNGSAGELHREALRHLEVSLPRGVTLRWVDEFTGEEHAGAPRLAHV